MSNDTVAGRVDDDVVTVTVVTRALFALRYNRSE